MYSASPSARVTVALASPSDWMMPTCLSASLRVIFASYAPLAVKPAAIFSRSEIMRSKTASLFSVGMSRVLVSMAVMSMPYWSKVLSQLARMASARRPSRPEMISSWLMLEMVVFREL